jgi:hypothetical protein
MTIVNAVSNPLRIEKDIFEVKINLKDLSINKDEVVLSLGYLNNNQSPSTLQPDQLILNLIDDVISQLEQRCKIRGGYRILHAHKSPSKNNGLFLENTFFTMDKIVAGQLRKSEKAAVFVCTIGPQMENLVKELMAGGDPLLSYVVDVVASIVVENAADFLHEYISRQMIEHGLKVTNRYSPGYCNWPVSEQQLLFSLLPENFCGVTLSESSLMLPIKSISGVIGIGSSVKMKEYLCDKCGMQDCTYRSKRRVSSGKKINTKAI